MYSTVLRMRMYSTVLILLLVSSVMWAGVSTQGICCVKDGDQIQVSSDFVTNKKHCTQGQCVHYKHSKTFCAAIEQKRIRTDIALRNQLLDVTCGFLGNDPLVCAKDTADINPPCNNRRKRRATCGEQAPALDPMKESSRIAGGKDVVPGTWPWMAMLRYNRTGGEEVSACGGVLVADRWVLTAAHCLDPRGLHLLKVRLGENDVTTDYDCKDPDEFCVCKDICNYSSGEDCLADDQCAPPYQTFNVRQKVQHPLYAKTQNGGRVNDIGLIELERPVEVTSAVSPVCLPHEFESALPSEGWMVMGWGNTQASVGSPKNAEVMQQVDVRTIRPEDCATAWEMKLQENQICATPGETGKAVCQGDSGGPLIRKKNDKWEVHGVVSGGALFCGDTRPTFFTQVNEEQVEWIERYIGSKEE